MVELVDEHEAAKRLGMPVKEVVYRLDYGQMMGTKVGESWQIDTRDLAFFAQGERLGDEAGRTGKAPVGASVDEAFEEISADASPGWHANPEYEIDLEVVPAEVQVMCGGATVARSCKTLLVMELGHGPVYYLPKSDVNWQILTPTQESSYCQYKGFASYWSLGHGDRVEENVAWAYEEPHAEVRGLTDHIGLYWHRMDAWYEDGVAVEKPRDIAGRCDARHSFRALYPDLARQWHPRKNPNIWPYECAPWFHAVVWWHDDEGREWKQAIRDRVLGRPAPEIEG
ncbi:MAG: DUF427 domain-containing protein [Alphaproteobacteria bacterium]|nr:DUF427 domain-containing protein [Alphaproteobacteria bacterium]